MENQSPHVLFIPFPIQGHINAMLHLATLLSRWSFRVSFLNSDHIHQKMLDPSTGKPLSIYGPSFQWLSIPDGLALNHPRVGPAVLDLLDSMKKKCKPVFHDLLKRLMMEKPTVNCIVADGMMSFTIEVTEELGIPTILFRTGSPASFWASFCIPLLIQGGELPLKENADMDQMVTSIPAMQEFLRLKDLPSFCRVTDLSSMAFRQFMNETQTTHKASALILNTFTDLELPLLIQIQNNFPATYTIGPVHAWPESKIPPDHNIDKRTNDTICLKWLDKQRDTSVIYVSFGSIVVMSNEQILELCSGLVNSKHPFLWVFRQDMVAENTAALPKSFIERTKGRCCIVSWAPQVEVLQQPSIGAFFTHCGWNSVMESIHAGVPMICCPFYVDQQINSRFVSHVWKNGVEMGDIDKNTIEKAIKKIMEGKEGEDMRRAAIELKEIARKSVENGGSSYNNLENLMEKLMQWRDWPLR